MDNAVKVIVIRQPALCMLFLASLERHPLLHLLFDLELCLLRSSFLAHIIPLTIAAPKATASCHYPPEPDWLPTVLCATVCYALVVFPSPSPRTRRSANQGSPLVTRNEFLQNH